MMRLLYQLFLLTCTVKYVAYCDLDEYIDDELESLDILYWPKYTHNIGLAKESNVSGVSSSNCPSSAFDKLATFEGNKICITDSYNSLWNGQYEWKSYASNRNGTFYQHIQSNNLIYGRRFTNKLEEENTYYLSDYEANVISTTRCISNNIAECNGKWQNYYNNKWNVDTNMHSFTCNDLCLYNNDELIDAPFDPVRFMWHNQSVYVCKQCAINVYLYLYNDSWVIGPNLNGTSAWNWNWCELDNKSLNSMNCLVNGLWQSFVNNTWISDYDITVTQCISNINYKYSKLSIFQEKQICINNTMDSSMDGMYKWLYYDSFTNSSTYYNK
eukprot:483220_1